MTDQIYKESITSNSFSLKEITGLDISEPFWGGDAMAEEYTPICFIKFFNFSLGTK